MKTNKLVKTFILLLPVVFFILLPNIMIQIKESSTCLNNECILWSNTSAFGTLTVFVSCIYLISLTTLSYKNRKFKLPKFKVPLMIFIFLTSLDVFFSYLSLNIYILTSNDEIQFQTESIFNKVKISDINSFEHTFKNTVGGAACIEHNYIITNKGPKYSIDGYGNLKLKTSLFNYLQNKTNKSTLVIGDCKTYTNTFL